MYLINQSLNVIILVPGLLWSDVKNMLGTWIHINPLTLFMVLLSVDYQFRWLKCWKYYYC